MHARPRAPRRNRSFSFIVGICSVISAITFGGCKTADSNGCVSDCERQFWPRVIVGILKNPDQFSLMAQFNQSGMTNVIRNTACPTELEGRSCTFSTWSGKDDTAVTLRLSDGAGAPISEDTFALGAFNYCGRDIAYVEFTPDAGTGSWSEPRYLTPCTMLQ